MQPRVGVITVDREGRTEVRTIPAPGSSTWDFVSEAASNAMRRLLARLRNSTRPNGGPAA